jgi:hypothetical protein
MIRRMTSRVGDIIIDCNDPELMAWFWSEVLGYRIFARDETGVAIRGATVSPDILFIRVTERKTVKNRLHFDVCPTDCGQEEELTRLLDLGAKRVGHRRQRFVDRIGGSRRQRILSDVQKNSGGTGAVSRCTNVHLPGALSSACPDASSLACPTADGDARSAACQYM